jgi:hypothetical protein
MFEGLDPAIADTGRRLGRKLKVALLHFQSTVCLALHGCTLAGSCPCLQTFKKPLKTFYEPTALALFAAVSRTEKVVYISMSN